MKPLKLRLQASSSILGINIQVVEKDYALTYILAGIANEQTLSGSLIFKGGTALKKLIFGNYRFSEDLDFSTINAPKGDDLEAAVRNAANYTAQLLAEHGPFTIQVDRYLERDPHPQGQEAFTIRVQFPWHPSPLCRIKLEINHDEPVILEPDLRPIIHGYEEEIEAQVRCYRLEEIITEKMRSLLQTHKKLILRGWNRPRARDYYDLWRLLQDFEKDIDKALLPELLLLKCKHKGVSYAELSDFFTDDLVSEARTHWDGNLGSFIRDLPVCDTVLDDLRNLLPRYFPGLQ